MKFNRSRKYPTLENNLDKRTSMVILPFILSTARNLSFDVMSETSFKSHSWVANHGLEQFLLIPFMLWLPQLPAARSSMNKSYFFWTRAQQTKQCPHRWHFGFPQSQPVQAQTPRAEHRHRGHDKSLDPTSHCVLACSQLLLLHCKHKSENGEGKLSRSCLCYAVEPLQLQSLPQGQFRVFLTPNPFHSVFCTNFHFPSLLLGQKRVKGEHTTFLVGEETLSGGLSEQAGYLWNYGCVQASLCLSTPTNSSQLY